MEDDQRIIRTQVLVAILERIGLQKKLMWSLESHPDTDIFSKRRKIYSICVDDRDDTDNETVLASCSQVNGDQCFDQIFLQMDLLRIFK